MKMRAGLGISILLLAVMQGCDSNQGLLDDDRDTRPLNPRPPIKLGSDTPTPPASGAVLTTTEDDIMSLNGEVLTFRGANVNYTTAHAERVQSVDALKSVGSNVVRILVDKDTTADQLRNILDRAVEQDVVAMLVFTGPEGEIACTRDKAYLLEAVEDFWLDQWMPVLAEGKYQSHLMINIAHKWGPKAVFSAAASISYEDYIETYKYFIEQFRDAGFRVPLVIDAPGCGADHLAFLGGRAEALLSADEQQNLVLSVHAFGVSWNSQQEIQSNTSDLQRLPVPFVVTEFGGSGVDDTVSLDHIDFMEQAAGNKAMALDLPWADEDDVVSYVYELDAPVSVLGQNVRMDVHLPYLYVSDGKLSMQMYLRDADGNIGLYPETYAASKVRNRWNRLSSTAYELSDFAEVRDAFTGENVTHIGLRISANDKSPDVGGRIMVDNIVLGGELGPVYEATFDYDTDGWARRWGASVSEGLGVFSEDGALNVLPAWGGETPGCGGDPCVALTFEQAHLLEPAIDLSQNAKMTFDIFVPEEYQVPTGGGDPSIVIQPFLTDFTDYNQYASLDYIAGESGRFTFGAWSTITVPISNFAATHPNFDIAAGPQRIGIQINRVFEAKETPIRIDNVKIEYVKIVTAGVATAYETSFDSGADGWYSNENESAGYLAMTVGNQSGSLSALPDVDEVIGEERVKYSAQYNFSYTEAQAIDFENPVTFRYRFYVPESYDGESPIIHLYMNGSGGETPETGWNNWSGFLGVNFMQGFTPGQWVEGERTFNSFSDFNPSEQVFGYNPDYPPKAVGFEIILNPLSTKSDPILFDDLSIEITYPAEPNPLETNPIVMDFDQPSPELLPVDQAQGFVRPGWDSVMESDVATIQFGVEPFGWLAWSWIGGGDGWDMSVFPGFIDPEDPESGVSLTVRGDDIVHGEHGILQSVSPD